MRKAFAAAAFLALTLTGCGLEIIPYLVPPGIGAPASDASPYFYVINQATTVVEFRGFELYYKFYDSSQTIESGFTKREQLTANNFSRMCSPNTASDQHKPLIDVDAVDRTTGFTTELDFNSVNTAAPYAQYGGGTARQILIRRLATDPSGNYKTFKLSDLQQGDADMVTVTWPGTGGTLTLVVYALSYGVQDYSTDIYSDARYLGSMTYYGLL